ncbi:MAG: hypothetical protein ACT4TC_20730 [Myxococcaceae bacterium]
MTKLLTALALITTTGALALPRDRKGNVQGDFNVFVKGGVGTFTGGLKSAAQAGPAYGVVLNMQPWQIIGFELGYDGSRHVAAAEAGAGLYRNGGTALIKLGLPLLTRVRPFVGSGIGATYVSTFGASNTLRNDLMEEIPLMTGLEFNLGALTAGVRGGYRFLLDEDFAQNAPNFGGLVDVTASIGGRF